MKAVIYARVSTIDQEPENQLQELRRYIDARGWSAVEYVDRGVSGAKERRPALDQLLTDAKRRRFDVLVCWRLDRLGRNLKHLITVLEELQALERPCRDCCERGSALPSPAVPFFRALRKGLFFPYGANRRTPTPIPSAARNTTTPPAPASP